MNIQKNKKTFDLLYKEQNECLKKRLNKIKSSNYINYPQSLILSKYKIKKNDIKSNKKNKSKKSKKLTVLIYFF